MKPARIDEVTALEPGVLEIRWTTGETLVAHVGDWIERFEQLAPLRDAEIFSQVRVGRCGHAVEWSGDIDLGADQLYERCKEEAGLPTSQLFDDWMKRNQLSLSTAAESLGLSRRTVACYRAGAKPIPRAIWFACLGWEVTCPQNRTLPRALPTAREYAALHA
ncbi:MAG: DUF2442 domain-containing protein [Sulfuricellaceae bacterium]